MTGVSARIARWTSKWTGTVFLIGGVLWFVDTVSLIFNRFLGGSELTRAVEGVGFLAALIAMVVGVIGFHGLLSERTPRLARAGVFGIALAVVGIFASIALTLVPVVSMSLVDGLFIVSIIPFLGGFLSFGVGSVRTATPTRSIGVLLLAATAIFLMWVVLNAVTGADPPNWAIVTLAGVTTLVTLVLGVQLRQHVNIR